MSTTRRQLGKGPSAEPTDPAGPAGRRLLPAERADPEALLADREHDETERPTTIRRPLGGGTRA